MRLAWLNSQDIRYGRAFGYTRAIEELRAAFVRAGGVLDPDAEVTFTFNNPDRYVKQPGSFSILYTMYENPDLPPHYRYAVREPDLVIVPSRFCRDVFQPYVASPVEVVPLGVDVQAFPGTIRPRVAYSRGKKFRWLWVGAADQRKGWEEVRDAWRYAPPGGRALQDDPTCEIVFKTTSAGGDHEQPVRAGNAMIEPRSLSHADLLALYTSADAFVFPSRGEGWGLTALEAFATGLPCVMTLARGVLDYADESVCIPVKHHPWEMVIANDYPAPMIRADVPDLANKMRWVMGHWNQARKIGLAAHRRAQHFTWDAAGRKLLDVLRRRCPSAASAASPGA